MAWALARRLVLVAGLALALFTLAPMVVPFERIDSSTFGADLPGCAPAFLNAFQTEDAAPPPDSGEAFFEQLATCRELARRRLMRGVIKLALVGAGALVAYRLLRDPGIEPGNFGPGDDGHASDVPLVDLT
jgi:hypothetical protein